MRDHESDLPLDLNTQALLDRYGFDRPQFDRLRAQVRASNLSEDRNRIRDQIEPIGQRELASLSNTDADAVDDWTALGRRAIANGEVGCVVLAGGMATRFGGVVKAMVEALPGHTFLQLKLKQIAHAARGNSGHVPVALMTSFSTNDALTAFAAGFRHENVVVDCFAQFISLRLTLQGELFRDVEGCVSPYSPGHGDLTFALRRSGVLTRFIDAGGRHLCVSNLDNLAATLDPTVIGFHIASGAQITAEVVRKEPGEHGGAPARVNGRLQVVEDFRFPREFDQDTLPVANANTFVMDARAIDQDFALDWFAVKKTVDGVRAIQCERLVGQLTAFLPTAYLEVPRQGRDSRFSPVKDPAELAARQHDIDTIMRQRGAL